MRDWGAALIDLVPVLDYEILGNGSGDVERGFTIELIEAIQTA